MTDILAWLKERFPVLLSPQFQGIVATAFFHLALREHWLNESFAEFFRDVIGAATIVGTTFKGIKNARTVPPPLSEDLEDKVSKSK